MHRFARWANYIVQRSRYIRVYFIDENKEDEIADSQSVTGLGDDRFFRSNDFIII